MKILELIQEQGTITSIGSTTGTPQTVSQTSTSSKTATPPQVNPKMKQLSATLNAAGIAKNDSDVSDFINAYSAKKANPNQEIKDPKQANMIAALAVNKDPNLDIKINQMIQGLAQNNQMGKPPAI